MKTTEEKALDAVKKRNADQSDFRVLSVIPKYLEGTLYIIGFLDEKKVGYENYVYIPDDEDAEVHVYRNTLMLTNAVSIHHRRTSAAEKFLHLGGVTGALALIVTATICYLTVSSKGELKIPEVLSGALTSILGFYFGTKVSRDKT